ncbi:DUF2076 domain-containing protein [Flaviflagellibacter deserti]
MQAQERQLIMELFDRLRDAEGQPRDREVQELLGQELRRAPNAVYTMAQTIIAQNQALELASRRIEELERRAPQDEDERYAEYRQPGAMGAPSPWQRGGSPSSGQGYEQPAYGDRTFGAPQQQRMGMGGGGGFLAGAGQVAMGVAGGMLVAEAAKSLLGAGGEATSSAASGAASAAGLGGAAQQPDQGSNALGQEAGLGDVGDQSTADAGNEGGGGGGFFDWLTGRGGSENNQDADQDEKDLASHDDDGDWDDGGDDNGWA